MENNDLLDYDLGKKKESTFYSKRSFYMTLFTTSLIIFQMFVILTPSLYMFSQSILPIISISFKIAAVVGFYNAFLSVTRKERRTVKKILGLIGNTIFFIIVFLGSATGFYYHLFY